MAVPPARRDSRPLMSRARAADTRSFVALPRPLGHETAANGISGRASGTAGFTAPYVSRPSSRYSLLRRIASTTRTRDGRERYLWPRLRHGGIHGPLCLAPEQPILAPSSHCLDHSDTRRPRTVSLAAPPARRDSRPLMSRARAADTRSFVALSRPLGRETAANPSGAAFGCGAVGVRWVATMRFGGSMERFSGGAGRCVGVKGSLGAGAEFEWWAGITAVRCRGPWRFRSGSRSVFRSRVRWRPTCAGTWRWR